MKVFTFLFHCLIFKHSSCPKKQFTFCIYSAVGSADETLLCSQFSDLSAMYISFNDVFVLFMLYTTIQY